MDRDGVKVRAYYALNGDRIWLERSLASLLVLVDGYPGACDASVHDHASSAIFFSFNFF